MSQVTTGFATTDDGQQLYVRVLGDHGPVIACCNGVGVSTFFWKYVALRFRDRFRVILWDYRGHGLSSVPTDPDADLTVPRNARDLASVLDHVGVTEPAILMGHSMGCQVILEFHKQHPERVRALVPMFGTFGRPLDTFLDLGTSPRTVFRFLAKAASFLGRGSFRLMLPLYASPFAFALGKATGFLDRYYAARVDVDHYMEHLEHMDPRIFLRMVDQMADHDLQDHLADVHVPTLVFGGESDLFTPLHRAEQMARLIPDAELTVVAEGSHAAIVEHPETINLRIERFFQERLGL